MEIKEIESYISKIPDYPKPGILFYDISTLISNNKAFSSSIVKLVDVVQNYKFDLVASIDARGFLFGSVIAYSLNKGIVMIRKKISYLKKISHEYELEYGRDTLEINTEAKGKSFLLVDDLLATGGTANAAIELLKKAGGKTSCFLSHRLTFLNGRKKIQVPMESLIQY